MALQQGGRLLSIVCFGDAAVPYATSLRLQQALAERVRQGLMPDTLLRLQHEPVYTIGKRGVADDVLADAAELAALGVQVHAVPRGGQTTFHGPGQLVVYPIINLRAAHLGPRAYVEGLEECMIRTVGALGISARGQVPGRTGVWVGDRKIGAVGVRISHGVSTHGIALNVTTDLSYYDRIVPCGQRDRGVTSLQALLGGRAPPMRGVAGILLSHFCDIFGYRRTAWVQPDDLMRGMLGGEH